MYTDSIENYILLECYIRRCKDDWTMSIANYFNKLPKLGCSASDIVETKLVV